MENNQKAIINYAIVGLLVLVSIFVMLQIVGSGGNQIGNTFVVFMIAGGIIGLAASRTAIFLFAVVQLYADFLKRLTVIGDAISMKDVMISLTAGPVLVVTACCYCVLAAALGKIPFNKAFDFLLFTGCVLISLVGVAMADSRSLPNMGQAVLTSAMIGMPVFAAYALLREPAQQRKLLKCLVIGAIPMALYTLHQYFFGIAGWEEAYIRTGMSGVLYNFYIVAGGVEDMRPFSTMNTHSSVGAVSGMLFLIAFLILRRSDHYFQTKRHSLVYTLIALLMLASCVASGNRTTYFVPIFGLLLVFCFRKAWSTILFYAVSVGGFVAIVLMSEEINSNILDWARQAEETAVGARFGSIGTFQDRLKGFIELKDPQTWTPFGMAAQYRPFSHDIITDMLVKIGYVPLSLIIVGGGACLIWWHYRCLSIQDLSDRSLCIRITAILVATGICSVAYGNLLFVSPVNSMIGLMIAVGAVTIRRNLPHRSTDFAPAPIPARDSMPPRLGMAGEK